MNTLFRENKRPKEERMPGQKTRERITFDATQILEVNFFFQVVVATTYYLVFWRHMFNFLLCRLFFLSDHNFIS